MSELALCHGEPAWWASLFLLLVDGMIGVAPMALLGGAYRGSRGRVLPWALLIVGSAASLAVNITVADPTLWSRVIHAWPSFARGRGVASASRVVEAASNSGETAAAEAVPRVQLEAWC